MKRIIITHFGRCSSRAPNLKERHDMNGIANAIKKSVNGNTVHMVSSSDLLAMQGTRIIASTLGIQYKAYDILRSGRGSLNKDVEPEKVFEILSRSDAVDVIIVVTHPEYSACLARHAGKLHGRPNFPSIPTLPAHAWDVDIVIKTWSLMKPIF